MRDDLYVPHHTDGPVSYVPILQHVSISGSSEPCAATPPTEIPFRPQDLGETREGALISPVETGAGAAGDQLSPATRPSPLRTQLYSPLAQEPSPSTGHDHHLESFAATEGGGPGAEEVAKEPPSLSSAPPVAAVDTSAAATTSSTVSAVAGGDPRPPLHGNGYGTGFRGHAPPGVRVGETASTATAASVASTRTAGASLSAGGGSATSSGGKSREDSARSSSFCDQGAARRRSSQGEGGMGGAGGEAKLRVCTPTGDGGASDLALWVTLRDLEEEGGGGKAARSGAFRPFSSLSPVTAATRGEESVGGGRFSSSPASEEEAASFGGAAESEAKEGDGGEEVGGREAGGAPSIEREVVEGGVIESFSDAAPLLGTFGGHGPAEFKRSGGKGAGAGTRVAIASGSEAAGKRRPGERSQSPVDWCDVGPAPEEVVAGGVEGLWRSLSRALCGLLSFCHPHQGGRGGADWCR